MYSIAVLLAFGIGAVLMSSPQILMIIRLIGAFILLLIDWQYVGHPGSVWRWMFRLTKAISHFCRYYCRGCEPEIRDYVRYDCPGFTGEIPPEMSATTVLLLMSLIPIVPGIVIDIIWVYAAHAVKSASFFGETVCAGLICAAVS